MAQDNVLRRLFSGANGYMVAALAAATIILVGAAVIGARDLSDRGESVRSIADEGREATPGDDPLDLDPADDGPEATSGPAAAPGETGGEGSGAETGAGTGDPSGGSEEPAGPTGGGGGAGGPSTPAGTREGVHDDHFEWGVHAPVTLNGVPLNIAEDPITGIKGYVTALNRAGGIHGRKVRLFLEDDGYNTQDGKNARDALVKQIKPFFIAGTLGVDQINVVATAAGDAGIPYMAVGGPQPEWKAKGMYQVGSSYDQYMELLTRYICKHGKSLVGGNEIRIGTTTLDSPFILPVEERFVQKLTDRNCVVTPVDPDARGKVQKPDQQTTYRDQLLDLQGAYGGEGANLIIPLQDPVTTSRQVAELKQFPTYDPEWTFNNFAHDSDTTLTLMQGEWTGTRGMSGGCYHLSEHAYNPDFCAAMKQAHEIWVSLGHVEYSENAGGGSGGNSEYTYDESSWEEDGQGGSAGYQLVHFWMGAMKQAGPDPTREKFAAALNGYENYSDLLTTPITFAGSDNIMRGALGGTVWEGVDEGGGDMHYRQVTELTPGLVDHF